jgi:hypothetical protein
MFVINSITVDNQTVTADVTYTLLDSTVVNVSVPIFCPGNSDDVLIAVGNRELTEQTKYDAFVNNSAIKDKLDSSVVSMKFIAGSFGERPVRRV